MLTLTEVSIYDDRSVLLRVGGKSLALHKEDVLFLYEKWQEKNLALAALDPWELSGELGDFAYNYCEDTDTLGFKWKGVSEEGEGDGELVFDRDEMKDLKDLLEYLLSGQRVEDEIKELQGRIGRLQALRR